MKLLIINNIQLPTEIVFNLMVKLNEFFFHLCIDGR